MAASEMSRDEESTKAFTPQAAKKAFRARLMSSLMVNTALMLERVDEQMLPAMYLFVGRSLNVTPAQLGALTSAQAVTKAVLTPVGGILGVHYSRVKIIALGCAIWAVTAAAFGTTTSFSLGLLFWALNGVGIAAMIPNGESLVADFYSSQSRGIAFGMLFLTGNVGALLGGFYGTTLGGKVILGAKGWRFVCWSTAAVGLLVGALTWITAVDPPRPPAPKRKEVAQTHSGWRGRLAAAWHTFLVVLGQMKTVLLVPSFLLLVLEGTLNSMSTYTQKFLTLYLQLVGLSDNATAGVAALFQGGFALGGLLGGILADYTVLKWPIRGRANLAASSTLAGLPLAYLIFKGLPQTGSGAALAAYCVVGFIWAIIRSWGIPCCHNPTIAEVVPAHLRGMAYAFGRSLENAIGGAIAAPLVGIIAEKWFHFDNGVKPAGAGAADINNANALGSAIVVGIIVPAFASALCFLALNFTIERDMRRVADAAAAQAEAAAADAGQAKPLLQDDDGRQ